MNTNYNDAIDLARYSFLLVDPNRYERALLRGILLQLQAKQIVETGDATEAARVLHNERVDFMMLEYDMQGVDSVPFVHGVRRGKYGRDNIEMAIFMLSGRRDAASVTKASNCGIHCFIAKPFSLKTIRDRIHATLTRPPEFIRDEDYVGPDRRRRDREGGGDRMPLLEKPALRDLTARDPKILCAG